MPPRLPLKLKLSIIALMLNTCMWAWLTGYVIASVIWDGVSQIVPGIPIVAVIDTAIAWLWVMVRDEIAWVQSRRDVA